METPAKCNRQPVLTRQKLRELSFDLAGLYLPKELENYLLDSYNDDSTWLDDEGHQHRDSLTDEDIWYNIRRPIMEYAQIKNKMDELLCASDYLGMNSLTIKVNNKKADLLRWTNDDSLISKPSIIDSEDCGSMPF